jgi:uncharacterized protein involved in outer membrane biogenesis
MDSLTSTAPIDDEQVTSPRRRRNPLRWLFGIIVGLLLLLFVAWLILFITKGRFLKHRFEQMASSYMQRKVTVDGDFNLYFAPFNIAFLAEKISVANPTWARDPQFFAADRLALHVSTLPLIFGKRDIPWLDLEHASIAAEWDTRHLHNTWTFGGSPVQIPDIHHASITGTHVAYRDALMQLFANVGISTIQARDKQFENAIRFLGTGTLRGKPVSFSGGVLNPNQAVVGGKTNLVFHADAARTAIDVSGTLPSISRFEGSRLHFGARGTDMADLFKFIGVSAVRTRPYHIVSLLTYTGSQWEFTRLAGLFGDSDLSGSMVIAMPAKRMDITADLATRSLDILDAGPFIGYDPQRLDAMGAKGAIRQVNGHPSVIPDTPIPVADLGLFDANVHWHVGVIRAKNFPVSNIDVTLDLDHSQLRLHPARANLGSGTLTADVLLDGRRAPPLVQYDVHLSPTPLGQLLARFGVAQSGTTGTLEGRVRMRGYGASLGKSLASSNGRIAVMIPAGTLWERNVKLSELNLGTFAQKLFEKKLKDPVQVNCGLLGFTVSNGIAKADPILIDTQKSVITGNGGFSFRDESLDLSVRAKSKRFSLFSLQSPVGVNGYLAAPGINIVSKQLVTRAGAAVAAGVFLSPIATLAAFIDLGNAKAAACGPVLAGDTAALQRTAKGDPRKDVGKPPPNKGKGKGKRFLGIKLP